MTCVYGWGTLGGGCLRGLSLLLMLLPCVDGVEVDEEEAAAGILGIGLIPPSPWLCVDVFIGLIGTTPDSTPTPVPPCLVPVDDGICVVCCRGEGEVALPLLVPVIVAVDACVVLICVIDEDSGESL